MIYGLTVTDSVAQNYISAEKNMAVVDTVRAFTGVIEPAGVLLTDEQHIAPITDMKMFSSKLLRKGYINFLNGSSLRIPVRKTINHNLLQTSTEELNLYFIVGPNNELSVGPESGNPSERVKSPPEVVKGRTVYNRVMYEGNPVYGERSIKPKDEETVYDQQLTGVFLFTLGNQSIDYALHKMMNSCIKYSACKHLKDTSQRTLAAVHLAKIYQDENRFYKEPNNDGSESLVIKHLMWYGDIKWKYGDFFYERNRYLDIGDNIGGSVIINPMKDVEKRQAYLMDTSTIPDPPLELNQLVTGSSEGDPISLLREGFNTSDVMGLTEDVSLLGNLFKKNKRTASKSPRDDKQAEPAKKTIKAGQTSRRSKVNVL